MGRRSIWGELQQLQPPHRRPSSWLWGLDYRHLLPGLAQSKRRLELEFSSHGVLVRMNLQSPGSLVETYAKAARSAHAVHSFQQRPSSRAKVKYLHFTHGIEEALEQHLRMKREKPEVLGAPIASKAGPRSLDKKERLVHEQAFWRR
mmetsp:Transcript_2166/g.4988  ORF Transcript_2166/g.4988 Transcript_2166/m.4988 type:complete len:147 (+) Transcript_2166:813-1253(+)